MLNNKIILGVAVAVVATAGYYMFSANGEAALPQGGQAPSVDVAAVLQKQVVEWDEFSGRLTAIDTVEIRPRVSGTVEAVHFQEGAIVNKGDLLFTIDPRPYAAQVRRAQAQLTSAKASYELAETEMARAKPLVKDGAITKREFDVRQNAFLTAQAQLEEARAALTSAELNFEYAHIKAPVAGRVSRAEITVGNMVQAEGGNPPVLTTVVSSNPIYADFEIDEQAFLRYIQSGSKQVQDIPVFMGLANEEGTPHKGYVKSFDNQLSTKTGTIRVRAVFDNPENKLVVGLYAKVKIGGSGQNNSLLVSDAAIGTDQSKKFVLVVGADNKVEYRNVALGPVVEGMRVIRSGLKAGEHVIVSGMMRARPGDVVSPQLVGFEDKKTAASAPEPATAAAH